MHEIRQLVAPEFARVNDLIIEELHSRVPLVENIGHYIVDAGGKRLRPLLVLLVGGMCGAISTQHISLAGVIEFIHTATLLHDDVVDLSSLRRGRATANAKWGNAPSVLVGDFLYSRAFQLMVRMNSIEIMALLSNTTNTIAEGEVLQLINAGDPSTTEAAYFDVIKNKTAVLFAAAAQGSGILSSLDATRLTQLYQYGLHLGIAFQLIDDVLDYRGDSAEMGKNVGDDLTEGKPTLPLIYTLQRGSAEQKALIDRAIREKSVSDLTDIIEAVSTSGALQYTIDVAQQQAVMAGEQLGSFPNNQYRQALYQLTQVAVNRRY